MVRYIKFFIFGFQVLLTIPSIIAYFIIPANNKLKIDLDLNRYYDKAPIHFDKLKLSIILIYFKSYRNIFYKRVGSVSNLFSWILPKEKTFYLLSSIDSGAYCPHTYATILNAKSIGKNFSCRQCTTIGNKQDGLNNKKPIIGDNVTVGANAVIIGDIKIGNNVVIGAGSVVVKDIPDNTIVVGNPAHSI